ncbi:DUF3592 domain-containing protein [Pontibacter sp. 13R65]
MKPVEQPTYKFLGFRISRYSAVQNAIMFTLFVVGIYGYFHKKEMLKDYSITTGTVVWIGRTPGKRVGQPECKYEYSVNGQVIRKTSVRPENWDVDIGDCLIVKYSNKDPEMSELEISKGKVACKQ